MKFALNDKAKMLPWLSGDGFLNFIYVYYAWITLTCSRRFPRGVASGGFHLFWTSDNLTFGNS